MNKLIEYLRKNTIFMNYDPLKNRFIFNLTQMKGDNSCISIDADEVFLMGVADTISRLELLKTSQM